MSSEPLCDRPNIGCTLTCTGEPSAEPVVGVNVTGTPAEVVILSVPLIALTHGLGGSKLFVPMLIVKVCDPPRPSDTVTV